MKPQIQIKKKRGTQYSRIKIQSYNRPVPDPWQKISVGRGQFDLQQTLKTKDANFTWGNDLQGLQWTKVQKAQQQYKLVQDDISVVNKFIENQLILMQPSPVKHKLEELRKKGKKFVDDRFPPNKKSLCGEWGDLPEWKWVEWVNISDKIPNASIFKGKIQPQDIRQGQLGDCYFLAGLAALAQRPDRIFNLFLTQQKNQLAYYSVKMLYKGKWLVIDMDQKIPWLYTKPAFSNAVDNQLWVILLQKAWAKLYTSYKRIDSGYPEEPLHDLTGAPIKQIYIKKGYYDKRKEWEYLLEASRLQYSMVCSSNPGSDSDQSQSGVVQGHAYTLLKVDTLNFKGVEHKLVQLRNPWGQVQFKGEWSDSDKNWNYVSRAEKDRLGYLDKEDGIFFMPFDQFWKQFRTITIAQINDDASYVYKSFKDRKREGCFFKVQIKKEGTYSLQIDKTPERFFEDKLQQSYRYPDAIVELGYLNKRKIQKIKGFSNADRTTQRKYNFQPGIYIVKVIIDFDSRYEKDYDVNLAIYADYPCIIQLANNQQASMLEGRRVSWTGQEATDEGSWNSLGAYGYNSDDDSSQREESETDKYYWNRQKQQDYNEQSDYWWRTSAGPSGLQKQPSIKLKDATGNKPQEPNRRSTVMQILKDRLQFVSSFEKAQHVNSVHKTNKNYER